MDNKKVNIGDLVTLKIKRHTSLTGQKSHDTFQLVTGSHSPLPQYVESERLAGKVGIVLSENASDGYSDVYHVAFNDIIIEAYRDYFQKFEKSLNKTNN
jgi:hypothetical protein